MEQFEKYKGRLQLQCIISSIKIFVMIITTVLLIFLPFWHSSFNLSNLEITLANYSLYDIFLDTFRIAFDEVIGKSILLIPILLLGLSFLYAIFIIIWGLSTLYKAIHSFISHESFNDYVLKIYDGIKRLSKEGSRMFAFQFSTIDTFFVFEFVTLLSLWGAYKLIGKQNPTVYLGLPSYITGVNGWIILIVLFVAASFALSIVNIRKCSKIGLEMMKEDYNIPQK